jgi:hypothetical protein
MTFADPLLHALTSLDTMTRSVSAWEAEFLESVLRQMQQGRTLSPKQRAVITRMCEKYCPELAAEMAGQYRLPLKESPDATP